jgi:hypothetical protein
MYNLNRERRSASIGAGSVVYGENANPHRQIK